MPVLALSGLDVLLVIGLGAVGFAVVALVCAAILAMLHLILPAADSGAEELDRLDPPAAAEPRGGEGERVDTEANA